MAFDHNEYVKQRSQVDAEFARKRAECNRRSCEKWRSAHRALFRQLIVSAKNRPCADCGGWYPPYVMQFDHKDRRTKSFNVAAGFMKPLVTVAAEIAKCEVVCANCHAERTHKQRVSGVFRKSQGPKKLTKLS